MWPTGIIALSLLGVSSVEGAAKALDDLFDVVASCDPYRDTLQVWLEEASEMAAAAFGLLPGLGSTEPDRAGYYTSYFGAPETEFDNMPYQNMYSTLFLTKQFLEQGQLPGDEGGQKPFLLCDDKLFTKQSPNDIAKDSQGDDDVDENGNTKTILNEYGTDLIFPGEGAPAYYWVGAPVFQYFFTPTNPVPGEHSPCIVNENGDIPLGVTFYREMRPKKRANPRSVILLCPSVFTEDDYTDRLGDVKPMPPENGETGTQSIAAVQPRSSILLHELYHYCPNNFLQTQDVDGGYLIENCLTFPADQATINAQSYTFFGIGAWYTLNEPVDGRSITFADGRCEYIREG